jgi:hypothetical protein
MPLPHKSFFISLVLILSACLTARAQQGEYYLTKEGVPMTENNYSEIDGHPYVFEKWMPGKAITDKGRVFEGDLKLKYNVYDDQLIFVYDTGDQPLLFADPIKSFVIFTPQPLTFVNGFPPIDKQTAKTYYQAIAQGKVSILKKYVKTILETKAYNSGKIDRKFTDDVAYYIYREGKIAPFKKAKDAVLEVTADKGAQVEAYIKSASINVKKDDDLAKLFNYYNTL